MQPNYQKLAMNCECHWRIKELLQWYARDSDAWQKRSGTWQWRLNVRWQWQRQWTVKGGQNTVDAFLQMTTEMDTVMKKHESLAQQWFWGFFCHALGGFEEWDCSILNCTTSLEGQAEHDWTGNWGMPTASPRGPANEEVLWMKKKFFWKCETYSLH